MSKRDITKAEAGKEVATELKKSKEAKAIGKRVKMTPPPAPPVKLGEVVNPILEKKSLKRALTCAIVKLCTRTREGKLVVDEEKAGLMVRTSGILFKAGWKEEAHTDALVQSEWTGRPYVRFITNTTDGKVYEEKHPEKVKACMPFAKELKEAVDKEHAKVEAAPAPAAATV